MRKTFEDALNALIDEYSDRPLDEIISALELTLMGAKEQAREQLEGYDDDED